MKTIYLILPLLIALCAYESFTQRRNTSQPQNYYKVLGINENASDKDIKRAFKKLSAKYHPDKFQNQKEKQKAKEKFMVIANAYDVLSDEQTRKVYDQYGAEGVRQQKAQENMQQQGNHQFNHFGGFHGGDDFFNSFFNHGSGGGGGFHFNFDDGGGHHHHQQHRQQKQMHPDLYQNCDVIKLDDDNYVKIEKRREVMFVVFYDPDQEECRQQQETIKELANKNYDYFGVAAVNCRDNNDICQKFGVQKAPKIFLYPQNITASKEEYKGPIQESKMKVKAFAMIQNFIEVLNQNNIKEFWIKEADKKVPVILFSEKKVLHPIFKIISKMHKTSIKFGMIKKSGSTFSNKLIEQFKITKFPSVILVKGRITYEYQLFNEEFKRQNLSRWISLNVKKVKSQNQQKGNLFELTQSDQKYNFSCTDKDSKVCVILFKNSSSYSEEIQADFKRAVAETQNASKLKFAILDVSEYSNYYLSIVNQVQKQNLVMIMIKGKGKKYMQMSKVQEALNNSEDRNRIQEAIKQQIQDVVSGGARFKKFRNFPTIQSSRQNPSTDL